MTLQMLAPENASSEKYRLITRSDFDGLVCAALLSEIDLIEEIKFVHPKDMQDGKIEITGNDITTNLPYVAGAHLVFDHHYSEILRNEERPANYIIDAKAPSTARVVYNYYGGQDAFPHIALDMMNAVDKADSANYTRHDILFPSGWVLLNYLLDPRSGFEYYQDFQASHYNFMMMLIDYCKTHSIDDILQLPEVKTRIDLFFEHQKDSMYQIERNAQVHGTVVVVDLREVNKILVANRFIVYAMYPESQVSIHILDDLQKQQVMFAVGRSIIESVSKVNIGELMLQYGGGGHERAGTCKVPIEEADRVLDNLIKCFNNQSAETDEQKRSMLDTLPTDDNDITSENHDESLTILDSSQTDNNETQTIDLESLSGNTETDYTDVNSIPIATDNVSFNLENIGTELATHSETFLSTELAQLSANFTATPYTGISPLQVKLDASPSKAEKGFEIINYKWLISSNQHIAEGITSTVLLSEAGEYSLTLRITDNLGRTAEDTQILTVIAKHKQPVAKFTISPRHGPAPLTVILDASACKECGSILDYSWLIDEQSLSGKIVTITLKTLGVHKISLTVRDNQGFTATQHQTVNVTQTDSSNWFVMGDDFKAELQFVGLKDYYNVGERVIIDIIENLQITAKHQRVDLWIAIESPDGKTYFMSDSLFNPFSLEPKPFKRSLESRALRHRVLEFEVPRNMGGNYTFYAIYNKEGADLNNLLFTQRSNLAYAMIVLSDR
jgi:nanoRNase/pAp phosphatase (c-di-AMP/oligoRNAs hydrolase)/PKD repeat protein